MNKYSILLLFTIIIAIVINFLDNEPIEVSISAVPLTIGGQDHTGPYNADPDWPLPLASLDDRGCNARNLC
jgi:hypothetical protein